MCLVSHRTPGLLDTWQSCCEDPRPPGGVSGFLWKLTCDLCAAGTQGPPPQWPSPLSESPALLTASDARGAENSPWRGEGVGI